MDLRLEFILSDCNLLFTIFFLIFQKECSLCQVT